MNKATKVHNPGTYREKFIEDHRLLAQEAIYKEIFAIL